MMYRSVLAVAGLVLVICLGGCGKTGGVAEPYGETGTQDAAATEDKWEEPADKAAGTGTEDKAEESADKVAGTGTEDKAEYDGAEDKAGETFDEEGDGASEEGYDAVEDSDDRGDAQEYEDPGEEFYGVFVSSAKDNSKCADVESRLWDAGFQDSVTIYTPDFSGLNPEPYYVVSSGRFSGKKEADERLRDVKEAGFKDAYIKYVGKYIGGRMCYTMYSPDGIEVKGDRIILRDVTVTMPYQAGGSGKTMTLYLDEGTKFDKSCDTSFFENYENGDSPYKWFKKNYNLISEEPDSYVPSVVGIFEVAIESDRITTYYGSYWWD